jgi:pantothenate synthetase
VATIEGEALIAVAARVGRARLIDNTIVRPERASSNGRTPT